MLPIVLVQFDARFYKGESFLPNVPNVCPIIPTSESPEGKKMWTRFQLPLSVAYANTVHKLQGMTLDKLALGLGQGGGGFVHGLMYVGISRVKNLQDLILRNKLKLKDFTYQSSPKAPMHGDFILIEKEYVRLQVIAQQCKEKYSFLL